MREILAVLFFGVALVGIAMAIMDDGSVDGGTYSTVCLNGVAYYDGYNSLAPAVDAETLTFIRCSK